MVKGDGHASRTKRSYIMFRLLAILKQHRSEERELALEMLRPEDTLYFKTQHFIPLKASCVFCVHQPFLLSLTVIKNFQIDAF